LWNFFVERVDVGQRLVRRLDDRVDRLLILPALQAAGRAHRHEAVRRRQPILVGPTTVHRFQDDTLNYSWLCLFGDLAHDLVPSAAKVFSALGCAFSAEAEFCCTAEMHRRPNRRCIDFKSQRKARVPSTPGSAQTVRTKTSRASLTPPRFWRAQR